MPLGVVKGPGDDICDIGDVPGPAVEATAVAAAVGAANMGPVRAYIAAAQAADFKIDEQVRL